MQSGHDVGKKVLEDMKVGQCASKPGRKVVLPLLAAKGVVPVTFFEWELLDREERQRGMLLQKPREKIVDIQEMLEIVKTVKKEE